MIFAASVPHNQHLIHNFASIEEQLIIVMSITKTEKVKYFNDNFL